MFTGSNALLMSNATAMVRVGGMGRPKPTTTMLLMLCSAVPVECLALNPCCVVMPGMPCVIYISSVYSPFSDRVGLRLHNIPSSGVLMKSIGAELF